MNVKFKLALILFFPLLFVLFSAQSAFAANVVLSGNIQDSLGHGISGATVSVNDTNSDNTTTDSSGNYSFSIPSGTYDVQVVPPTGSGFSSAIFYSKNIPTDTVLNLAIIYLTDPNK